MEQTVKGTAEQTSTQILVPMEGRSALFFMAKERGFTGLDLEDTGWNPPDTMGAVGTNHFVELLNGRIAVYSKTGRLVVDSLLDQSGFFHVDGYFPTGDAMFDPRIVYDHQSNRWVACARDSNGTGDVGLAISNDDRPVPLGPPNSNWKTYRIPFYRGPGDAPDFPTLGVDANGIYISVFYGQSLDNRVVAIDKAKLYANPPEVTDIFWSFDIQASSPARLKVIQPAVNFNAAPLDDLVWLITKGPPETMGTYQGGALLFRRLEWIELGGGNKKAQWKDANWQEIADPPSFPYRNYYDLDEAEPPIGAPQAGGAAKINLGPTGALVGSRLSMAVIRDRFLWTCHHVGLDGPDETYGGQNVDRSAVQWIKLHITDNGGLELQDGNDRGRIWDQRQSQPNWYYFPSLMVNARGDMGVGFSGSSETSFIGAYYCWRSGAGTAIEGPSLLKAGEDYFAEGRWGDYSCTSLDPRDGVTIWTVQEYAKPGVIFPWTWGTWVAAIKPAN